MRLARRTVLQALAALFAARPGLAASAPAPVMTLAIAGTAHHRYDAVAATLRVGDALRLAREPDNPHDPHAVALLTAGGDKLGYVPRRTAGAVAARLDAGEDVAASITGFLPTPGPGERFAIPPDLVRTWCEPGEPIVTLSA